jgi:hypothetical protein
MAVSIVGQPVSAIKTVASSASFASFSPTSNAYIIKCAAKTNGSGSPAASITGIAWASGGTIVNLHRQQINAFQPETSVWLSISNGTGAITVTGSAAVTEIFATVQEASGVDVVNYLLGGFFGETVAANNNTLTVACNYTGGLISYVALDTFEIFTPTPTGTCVVDDSWGSGGQESWGLTGNANTTSGNNYTVGVTNTLGFVCHLGVEIVPAATIPAAGTNPTVPLPLFLMLQQEPR